MNATIKTQINDTKRESKRRSWFWNTTTAIDQKNLFDIGTTQNNKHTMESKSSNIFTKWMKKVNYLLSIKTTDQEPENKKNKKIKHSRSMMDFSHHHWMRKPPPTYQSNRKSLITPKEMLLPLHFDTNPCAKNELNDWKNTLLDELDATRHGIHQNTDSNEPVTNMLQPSGMENNRSANQHFAIALDAKLGVISRKAMIDDWLYYNQSTPESTSYLQPHHCNKLPSAKKPERTLSAKLKKEGKKKEHDYIKERLEIAAARRNAIKLERLREQMDTALFETIHMIRENGDNDMQQQQHLQDWLLNHDKERKSYLSSVSTSLSSDRLSKEMQPHLDVQSIW